MIKSLVSVIVPVFNGEKYIEETLEAILNQDYTSKEVIVVDDGSEDGSSEIIQTFSEVKYIYQENSGVPVARNRGLREAKGEFIAFSDQDDLWKKHKLSDQVNYLLDNPEAEYVICKRKVFLEPGLTPPSWLRKELLDSENVDYSPSSLVARASAFQEIGMFNTEVENASDVDWLFKAKDAGIGKGVIEKVLYLKRIHENNHSRRVKELHREYLTLIRQSIKKQKQKE
jgi:glycosyltransferase involved in cell wall biosynthesis